MSGFFDVYCFIMVLLILQLWGSLTLLDYKLKEPPNNSLNSLCNAAPLEDTIAWLRLMYEFHISPEHCFYWYKSNAQML